MTSTNGTKIPKTYQPDKETRDFALENYPDLDLDFEADHFRDYHLARGSRYDDWNAAFRNWLRYAEQFNQEKPRPDGTPEGIKQYAKILPFGNHL